MVTNPLEAVPPTHTLSGGGSLLSLYIAPPQVGVKSSEAWRFGVGDSTHGGEEVGCVGLPF